MNQVSAKMASLNVAKGDAQKLERIFTDIKGPMQTAFLNFFTLPNASHQDNIDAQTKAYAFFLEALNTVRHRFGLVPVKNSDDDCVIL